MWFLMPRLVAASDYIRAIFPPPRMPMVAPRGRVSAIFARGRGDFGRLFGAVLGQRGIQLGVVEGKLGGSEQCCVGGAGGAGRGRRRGGAGGRRGGRRQAV